MFVFKENVIEIITHANCRMSGWPVGNYQELNLRPSHNKLEVGLIWIRLFQLIRGRLGIIACTTQDTHKFGQKLRSHFCLLLHLSSCWVALWQTVLLLDGSAGCTLALESSFGLRGPSTQAFIYFGGKYCLAPEAPLIRVMPTGPKVFLAMPDACGLRPCNRTHLKNSLVPHLYTSEAYDK